MTQARIRERVLGVPIDACSHDSILTRVDEWARSGSSRVVCFANVHVVTTAARDGRLRRGLEDADVVAPDGAPVAWALRRLGHRRQRRVDGPGWTARLCAHAARTGLRVYLYGSTPHTLELLERRLLDAHPGLQLAGTWSPPFRELAPDEVEADIERIRTSGAQVVLVGLGAPRQEQWMAAVRGRLPGVLVGVGAAFDFHAGVVRRAPLGMQRAGLEWLHRLASDPRRLWRRYLVGNARFAAGFGAQLVRRRTRRVLGTEARPS